MIHFGADYRSSHIFSSTQKNGGGVCIYLRSIIINNKIFSIYEPDSIKKF